MTESISVLHVEDDSRFAEMAAEFLGRVDDDITVTTEVDPVRALELLRDDPGTVDCIVSDYDMPAMDGLEFLKAVREEFSEMPFILFTGKGSEEIAAEAISAGVTDYLQKDAGSDTYEMLANRIRNAVEHRRAEADAARTHRFLEKVVERATDIIAVVNPDDEVVFVSGSVETVLGYSPEEVKAYGPFELVHPDDRERVEAHFEKRLSDPDRPTGITFRGRHKDGHYVRTRARAYNLVDDSDIAGVLIYTSAAEADGTS